MHEGRVVQQGSINDLSLSPATSFVTQFVRAQRRFDSTTAGESL
jgi:ABC-type proline/glycine betaine transport system ATPase subunit